jgi:hypothetical protein
MAGRPWTPEEDELARTLPPAEAARRTGRRLPSVYGRRHVLRVGLPERLWTPEEDELARTLPPKGAAERTGRTLVAVYLRRQALGVVRRHRG